MGNGNTFSSILYFCFRCELLPVLSNPQFPENRMKWELSPFEEEFFTNFLMGASQF
jgi:hypothetical protein